MRSLLEAICADLKIQGATLEVKVTGLESFLPKNIVENLHSFRFIGNKAMHELESPSRDDLHLAIEIVEDLPNFLYERDDKAGQLAKIHATNGSVLNKVQKLRCDGGN